jgi:hypothetical protein
MINAQKFWGLGKGRAVSGYVAQPASNSPFSCLTPDWVRNPKLPYLGLTTSLHLTKYLREVFLHGKNSNCIHIQITLLLLLNQQVKNTQQPQEVSKNTERQIFVSNL